MFERESKRERILEARMRELRLKMKVKSGQQGPGGGGGATGDQTSGSDQDVLDAEVEYRQIVEREAKAQQAPPTVDHILGIYNFVIAYIFKKINKPFEKFMNYIVNYTINFF